MPLRNHTCEKCGRQFKVPVAIKKPFCLCGHNKPEATQRTCLYRGQQIGVLDCACGGKPKVYFCTNLREPCIEHNTSKPWASVKPIMNERWTLTAQPMVCASCPLRTEKVPEKQG